MRRNVLNWFLCGLAIGLTLALSLLAAVAARTMLAAAGDFHAYPVLIAAVVVGGACWLFKRDGQFPHRPASRYCYISKERKARIENVL